MRLVRIVAATIPPLLFFFTALLAAAIEGYMMATKIVFSTSIAMNFPVVPYALPKARALNTVVVGLTNIKSRFTFTNSCYISP